MVMVTKTARVGLYSAEGGRIALYSNLMKPERFRLYVAIIGAMCVEAAKPSWGAIPQSAILTQRSRLSRTHRIRTYRIIEERVGAHMKVVHQTRPYHVDQFLGSRPLSLCSSSPVSKKTFPRFPEEPLLVCNQLIYIYYFFVIKHFDFVPLS